MNAFSCALNDKNVGADFVQSYKEFQISIPRSRAALSNSLSLPFGFLNNSLVLVLYSWKVLLVQSLSLKFFKALVVVAMINEFSTIIVVYFADL